MWIRTAAFLAAAPLAAGAEAPLSAIDWLRQNETHSQHSPVLMEPPTTDTATGPEIEVRPLGKRREPVGLVPSDVTGMPLSLWLASDTDTLDRLIRDVPVHRSAAMQTLLFTLLLSEALPPEREADADALLLARVDKLIALGAVDPAQTLIELAGSTRNAAVFGRWFDTTLLTGDEDRACAELIRAPHLLISYDGRIFCTARLGDWQTAALTLEAAHALKVLPPERLALLDRFLSPDIFEGAPPLALPDDPDPLTFRLFETIGERIPTASLPRAFANADLRDVAGWKAQLEAAERLARIGALPPNRLLGFYSARQAAASGGVWDRVSAIQRLETALQQQSDAAVAKTLPVAWNAMRTAGLEVAFAALFADDLARSTPDDPHTRALAWRIRLLSPAYEAAAAAPPDQDPMTLFLAALALGRPGDVVAPTTRAEAVADGFDPTTPLPARNTDALHAGKLGEVILMAMTAFDQGARGNADALTGALATFRKLGLEDMSRRASLQLILLERDR